MPEIKPRFVFIVSYGRSGSTILQKILNSIDGYLIRGENSDIVGHMIKCYQAAMQTRDIRNLSTNAGDPWFGAELLGPDKFARRLARLFVDEVLNVDDDYRVIGFKEIRYFEKDIGLANRLTFMRRFFAPAKFVFNVRDHNEVVKSGWWAKQNEENVRDLLRRYDEAMRGYHEANPDCTYIANYNEYTQNVNNLQSLFDFLGEEFHPECILDTMRVTLTH